ncbi:MAG TPA: hypothetical protein PL048_23010, partial [Leptospiraceae bacterium]|nr:hypothetical protein [Leptospiraceae bacterium]
MQFLQEKDEKFEAGTNKDGISKIIYKQTDKEYSSLLYDAKGKRAGEIYFRILPDGWETMQKSEAGFEKTVYNKKGSVILKENFGADGQPKADESGTAAVKYEYNEKGNLLFKGTFGLNGRPAADKDGIAVWKKKYNDKGDILSEEKFDV